MELKSLYHQTSKGDTTLRGAQAKADGIDANVGGQLKVESLQDTVEQNTKQTGVGGRLQASFGTAWQASGNFSSSKLRVIPIVLISNLAYLQEMMVTM